MKMPCFQGVCVLPNTVQVLFPAPSVPTLGTASELIRYDRLAFLYAKSGPMPPFSPVFRRITRLGLQQGPGSFAICLDQPRRASFPVASPRGYREIREISVRRGITAHRVFAFSLILTKFEVIGYIFSCFQNLTYVKMNLLRRCFHLIATT